jgi:hypothetical protein
MHFWLGTGPGQGGQYPPNYPAPRYYRYPDATLRLHIFDTKHRDFYYFFAVTPQSPVIVNEAGREATSQLGPYVEGSTVQVSCEVSGGNLIIIHTLWAINIWKSFHMVSGTTSGLVGTKYISNRSLELLNLCLVSRIWIWFKKIKNLNFKRNFFFNL